MISQIGDINMTTLQLVNSQTNDTQLYVQIERYRDLDRQIKALEREKKSLNAELKAGYFATEDTFIYQGRLLMTATTEISERIDLESLKLQRPDIYNLFQVESVCRKLRLK